MKKFVLIVLVIVFVISCQSVNKSIQTKPYPYKEAIGKMVSLLEKNMEGITNETKMAVLPMLDEKGNKTLLGDNISNLLQSGLYNPKKYSLVERERVDSILEEYEFSKSGLVDEKTIKEIGKLLAVNSVVVGTIRDEKTAFSLYCRIVNIETGKVLSIANALIVKDDNVSDQYKKVLQYSRQDLTGAYSFSMKRILINSSNQAGTPWDAFSNPDIVFIIKVDGKNQVVSKTYSDTTLVELEDVYNIILTNQSILEIFIYDEDMTSNELIVKLTFTPDQLKSLLKESVYKYKDGNINELSFSLKTL